MPRQENPHVTRAKAILRGEEVAFDNLRTLATTLKETNEFGYARKLFRRARVHPDCPGAPAERLKLTQQEALCTYKDPDLPAAARLTRALEILGEHESLESTSDQETLGLAGAIYKRRWEFEGQVGLLERALGYYLRGYRIGPARDHGYTAINAAFVLDLLAREESEEARVAGIDSASATARQAEARRIRGELVLLLPPLLSQAGMEWLGKEWWFYATLAEALFGLGRYEEAVAWLRRGPAIEQVRSWEFESTIRQLASLARLRADLAQADAGPAPADPKERERWSRGSPLEEARAWEALRDYLGPLAPALTRAFVGKVGLALSGGGFRASLFHIGVLAHLAERDVLRSVEVLSCVSGGSIVGAHYYLEVRQLLKTKADAEITRQDYIDIVKRVERHFLAGVETNIRCRVMASLGTNLKAAFFPNYTRTHRLGDLYEEKIFSRVADGEGGSSRHLPDLIIEPKDTIGFRPKYDNWRRLAKAPILVLNATTLNTGHNWQFTATWMGEPPAGIDNEIDGNDRLRRMYYDEAPPKYQRVRLGRAVAASSCVPGLFDPLALPNLYPDRTVRLVDGGVYDNQGVGSLMEQDCTVLLVSDATGQMESLLDPSAGMLGVPLRSFSVSMARVRQAEYHELEARRRSGLLRGLMFVHLKKDLEVDPIDWVGCLDPHDASDDARPVERRGVLTRYGIMKEVQQRLSAIRTDLDSFTEAEAFALMTSGYQMTEREFRLGIKDFPSAETVDPPWGFLRIKPAMNPGPSYKALLRRLDVGKKMVFKVWWTSIPLMVLGMALVLGVVAGLIWAWRHWADTSLGSVRGVGWTVIGILATLVFGPLVVRIVRFRKTLGQVGLVSVASVLAAFVFKIHLWFFDPVYLKWGRVDQVVESKRGSAA